MTTISGYLKGAVVLGLALTLTSATALAQAARPARSGPIALSPAGSRVWVVNPDSNSVSVLETVNDTVVAEIPVGASPATLAIHPDGSRVFVANMLSNDLSVVDTATLTEVARVPIGVQPYGVAVHPAGARLYVTLSAQGRVTVLDNTTLAVLAQVATAPRPRGLAIPADGTRVVVTHFLTIFEQVNVGDLVIQLPRDERLMPLRSARVRVVAHPRHDVALLWFADRAIGGRLCSNWTACPLRQWCGYPPGPAALYVIAGYPAANARRADGRVYVKPVVLFTAALDTGRYAYARTASRVDGLEIHTPPLDGVSGATVWAVEPEGNDEVACVLRPTAIQAAFRHGFHLRGRAARRRHRPARTSSLRPESVSAGDRYACAQQVSSRNLSQRGQSASGLYARVCLCWRW